jgi:hypothetical protein
MLEVFVGCRCWARASIPCAFVVWESWPDVMHAVGAAGSAEGEGFTRPWLALLLNWPAVEILSARAARYSSRRFIHKSTHPYLRTRSLIYFLSTFSSGWFFFRNAVSARSILHLRAWPRLVLVKAGCQISWIIASTARGQMMNCAIFHTTLGVVVFYNVRAKVASVKNLVWIYEARLRISSWYFNIQLLLLSGWFQSMRYLLHTHAGLCLE